MTWKSYVAFSSAGVLATYLFSTPTPVAPDRAAATRPAASAAAGVPADIQEQAQRLQARTAPDAEYHEPSRNPFRFGVQPAVAVTPRVPQQPVAEPIDLTPVEPLPERPPVRVSGIASQSVNGVRQRTAILATPSGLVTVREGDAVGTEYRVTRIEDDAVQLVTTDGTPLRITVR